jgi:hypothetical protein
MSDESASRSGGPPACRRAGRLARRNKPTAPNARRFDFEQLFRAAGTRALYGRRGPPLLGSCKGNTFPVEPERWVALLLVEPWIGGTLKLESNPQIW